LARVEAIYAALAFWERAKRSAMRWRTCAVTLRSSSLQTSIRRSYMSGGIRTRIAFVTRPKRIKRELLKFEQVKTGKVTNPDGR